MTYDQIKDGEIQSIEHDQSRRPRQVFIKVSLKLDSMTYQPGDYIRGTVALFVPKFAVGCNSFSGIHLSLEGQETIHSPAMHVLGEHPLRTDCTEIVHLPSFLTGGQHDYPFRWRLPESLPYSMNCLSEGSSCRVQYCLTAYLSGTEDSTVTAINARKPIYITARNEINYTGIGDIIEPKRSKVKSWFRKRGSLELKIDTEPIQELTNSTITVGITGRNLSSVPVKELLVQCEETVIWRTKGREWKTQEILGESIVQVHNVPSWQNKKGNINYNTVTADRITTPLELKNARVSYEGQLIQVQHSLKVTAKTKGKQVTRPKFTSPMEVHRQPDVLLTPVMVISQVSLLDANSSELNAQFNAISPEIEVPEAVAITNIDPVFCQVESEQDEIRV